MYVKQWETRAVFRWWRSDGARIRPEHEAALVETAEEMIAKGRLEAKACGEMFDWVRVDALDPEDGVHYLGWWEASTAGSDEYHVPLYVQATGTTHVLAALLRSALDRIDYDTIYMDVGRYPPGALEARKNNLAYGYEQLARRGYMLQFNGLNEEEED